VLYWTSLAIDNFNPFCYCNPMSNFLKGVFKELRNVTWPTKEETFKYVVNVIVFSFIVASILGLLDLAFSDILKTFILK
ncbi:MAG: preprotein translocase subunit SecE, partial [Candidatus Paceibacterota bacterium]